MIAHSPSNSYGTPEYILERVRATFEFEKIDTDPCSNLAAQERVQARIWYGLGSPFGECGLKGKWEGAVFINPPYGKWERGKSLSAPFVRQYWSYNEGPTIILLNVDTSTSNFREVMRGSSAVAFPRRIQFLDSEGKATSRNRYCQVIGYRGLAVDRFIKAFQSSSCIICTGVI